MKVFTSNSLANVENRLFPTNTQSTQPVALSTTPTQMPTLPQRRLRRRGHFSDYCNHEIKSDKQINDHSGSNTSVLRLLLLDVDVFLVSCLCLHLHMNTRENNTNAKRMKQLPVFLMLLEQILAQKLGQKSKQTHATSVFVRLCLRLLSVFVVVIQTQVE